MKWFSSQFFKLRTRLSKKFSRYSISTKSNSRTCLFSRFSSVRKANVSRKPTFWSTRLNYLDLIKRNRFNGLIQRTILIAVFLTCFFPSISFSQLNALEILNRVESKFKEIQDYTAEALVSVEMERLRIPRRKMKIFFKQPDKFHLESEGFAIIPRAGLGFMPSQIQHDKYDAQLVSLDTIETHQSYKLQLILKDSNKSSLLPVQSFYLWIDKENFVIRKIETATSQGRNVSVVFDYGMVDKKYLMPSNIVVSLQNLFENDEDIPDMPGRESRLRRLPRAGTITITFTKYLVNQNLPDNLFEKKEKP